MLLILNQNREILLLLYAHTLLHFFIKGRFIWKRNYINIKLVSESLNLSFWKCIYIFFIIKPFPLFLKTFSWIPNLELHIFLVFNKWTTNAECYHIFIYGIPTFCNNEFWNAITGVNMCLQANHCNSAWKSCKQKNDIIYNHIYEKSIRQTWHVKVTNRFPIFEFEKR